MTVDKNTSLSIGVNIYFHFGASCAEVIFIISLLANLSRSCTLGNAQNERAAIIERWCSKGIGDVVPTSGFAKIVNLYRFTLLATLCKHKRQRNHSRIGNNFSTQPVGNSPTSYDAILVFVTCDQVGHKLFWKFLRPDLFPIWEQVKYQIPHLSPSWREVISCNRCTKSKTIITQNNFCPNWAEVIFYSRRVVGHFTSRQFVGKLFSNFRPIWSEVIRRNTNWQAGQRGTTLHILQISHWNNLRKIACQGKHPCDPSNNICDIGCTSFQSFQKKNFVPNWDEVPFLWCYLFLTQF